MALEQHNGADREKVAAARLQYQKMVEGSPLGEPEKKAIFDWLNDDPRSQDLKELETSMAFFQSSIAGYNSLVADYRAKNKKAIAEDLLSPEDEEENMAWYMSLSIKDKRKYFEKDALDDPARVAVRNAFKKLPHAVRDEKYDEFRRAGFTKKKEIVAQWTAAHNELKARFLALPKEIQLKHREEFRSKGLRGREALLRSLNAVAGGMERGESAEKQELTRRYQKMARTMMEQNLLAPDSYKAYAQEWFLSLSLEEQRYMLFNSELSTRLNERRAARDEFYALPEEVRAPHELMFRNIDLDRRKEFLAGLKGNARASQFSVKYTDNEMERTLAASLESDTTVREKASVFTVVDLLARQRRKSEVEFSATKTETLVASAKRQKRGINEHQEVNIQDLTYKKDQRFSLTRFVKEKLLGRGRENVRLPNVTLRDKEKREVSSLGFAPHVAHVRSELEALLLQRAAHKLPGVDKKRLAQAAAKMELHRDLLHRETA